MSNALVVKTDLSNILEGIDFHAVNGIITTMGSMDTENISQFDRTNAVTIIGEWETNVIDKIATYGQRMSNFASYFNPSTSSYDSEEVNEEMRRQLAGVAGLDAMIEDFYGKLGNYHSYINNKPFLDIDEFTMTAAEIIRAENEHAGNMKIYNMKISRMHKELQALNKEFVSALAVVPEVTEIVKKAKMFQRNSKKFQTQCSDKAMAAKANVLIGNKELREALKGLVEFSIEL